MRTLDEVIKTLEDCEVRGGFFDWKYGISDAVHYLQNYRDSKAWLELEKRNYLEAVDNCEKAEAKYTKMILDAKRNDPLSWDDLCQMIGKPVWIEEPGLKHWVIISHIVDPDTDYERLFTYGMVYPQTFYKNHNNWQAYRKERE